MSEVSGLAVSEKLTATNEHGNGDRLDRRRVYIFPSRHGFALAAMLVVILLGAINYDNALGYLLSFLLSGLFLIAMLHTYHNLAGLRFVGARGNPVFAGDTAVFECRIDNESPEPRLAIDVCCWPRGLKGERRRYMEQFESRVDIDERETGLAEIRVDALRRGILSLERIRLRSVYPLGILRTWAYFESSAQCLVYPAPRGHLPLPQARGNRSGTGASPQLGTEDFAGMRPYSAGDPPRAIAWKTLAKEQDLMIKRFQDSATRRIWLAWDAVADIPNVEARLSQLTRWVLDASAAGATFGLEIPGERIEFGQGPQHRDRCLRALALFEIVP